MATRPRFGFTLLELFVSISIIGILVALLLPAIQRVRSSAARAACENKLRQIGLAFHSHEGVRHYLPGAKKTVSTSPLVEHNWAVYLLPYLEAHHVAAQYDFKQNWQAVANRPATSTVLSEFLCPANSSTQRFDTTVGGSAAGPKAVSDYAPITAVNSQLSVFLGFTTATFPTVNRVGAIGSDTITDIQDIQLSHISDGTSRTILLAEDADRPNIWRNERRGTGSVGGGGWADAASGFDLHGTDVATATATKGPCLINCHNSNEIYSFHREGSNFLMCDGSVHFIHKGIEPLVLVALATRRNNDRTPPPSEW